MILSRTAPDSPGVDEPAADQTGRAVQHRPFLAGLLLVTGLLLFACLDATTKYLASRYDVPFIVALRYIVNCLLMIVLVAPSLGRQLIETERTGLVLVRSGCLAAASLFVSLALQRMPVAETTAITFLAPVVVVILARPLLGEQTGPMQAAAALMGLAGVLLIVRPGSGLQAAGIAFATAAVLANMGYQLLSRMLAPSEQTLTLLFYSTLIGSICFGLAVPWFWPSLSPSKFELLLLVSLGVYGGLGHYLFTKAFRYAPASVLAPLTYLQLLWAGLLGYLIFGHVPDRLTLVGMFVILGSGLLTRVRLFPGR